MSLQKHSASVFSYVLFFVFSLASDIAAADRGDLTLGAGIRWGFEPMPEVAALVSAGLSDAFSLQLRASGGVVYWQEVTGAAYANLLWAYDKFQAVPFVVVGSGYRWGARRSLLGRFAGGIRWYVNPTWFLAFGLAVEISDEAPSFALEFDFGALLTP